MPAIAQQGGGGSTNSPMSGSPPSRSASSPSGVPPNALAGAGQQQAAAAAADAQRQQLEGVMQQIRQIGEVTKAIAQLVPMAAEEVNQIQQLLKAIVVKAAQGSPMQTASSMAVPGGGTQ